MAASARVAYKLEAAEIIAIFWLLFAGFGFGFSSRFSYFFYFVFYIFLLLPDPQKKVKASTIAAALASGPWRWFILAIGGSSMFDFFGHLHRGKNIIGWHLRVFNCIF